VLDDKGLNWCLGFMAGESKSNRHKTAMWRVMPLVVALFSTALAGCDTLSLDGGVPPSAESILVRDAEKRVSLAQDSLDRANSMITDGEKQRADGQKMIEEGDKRVSVGQTLKVEAERQLATAQREAADARARAGMVSDTGDAPVPQSRPAPISVSPY